ncbi:DUF596 domain-containing protein [Pantoea agglomerans]|uniref:DUF596 domain-containing protein n=2 Tax=Enterobacter agglomerans TaxID=549 RepID=UPI001AA0A671|nr:DUF596 domain-containing protein [Pantoea agglomerans]
MHPAFLPPSSAGPSVVGWSPRSAVSAGMPGRACVKCVRPLNLTNPQEKLKTAWPPHASNNEDEALNEYGMWFLVKCPVGVMWLTPDGKKVWT